MSAQNFCQTLDSFYHFERKVKEIAEEHPDVRKMDCDDLVNYIAMLEPDLADVVEEAFMNHAIDGRVFLKLRESDLDNLGIEKYSHRIILREIIAKSKRMEKQRRKRLRGKVRNEGVVSDPRRFSLNLGEKKNRFDEGGEIEDNNGHKDDDDSEEVIRETKDSGSIKILENGKKVLIGGSGSKTKTKSRKQQGSNDKTSRKYTDPTLHKNSFGGMNDCSMSSRMMQETEERWSYGPRSPAQCLFTRSIKKHQSLDDEPEVRFLDGSSRNRQRSISFQESGSLTRPAPRVQEELQSLSLNSASMIPHMDSAIHSYNFRASSSSSSSQDFDDGSEASEYYYLNKKDKSLRLKLNTTGKLNRFEIAKEDLDIDSLFEFIGHGEYGKVYKTRLYSSTDVAVKIFDNNKIKNQRIKDIIEEAELLLSIRFPNIIMCMGWCMHYRQLMLVFEYMSQGSLYKVLHVDRTPLPTIVKLEILRKISSGMEHLHSREILHCDLKSSNILLDENFRSVKVCDFGMSFLKSKLKKKNKWNSLSHYSAPEILRGEKFENPADVYSFGMIIWEMLTGYQPYSDIPKSHLVGIVGYDNNHQLGLLDSQIECLPLYELMLETLHVKPRMRPSFKEISKRLDLLIQGMRRSLRHRKDLRELFSCPESRDDNVSNLGT